MVFGSLREWIIWIETLEDTLQKVIYWRKKEKFSVWPRFDNSRPWKKKARLISRSFVRKLQRTKEEKTQHRAELMRKKNLNSIWTCFPWSFTGFHGFESFDTWQFAGGCSFPGTRSQREDYVGGVKTSSRSVECRKLSPPWNARTWLGERLRRRNACTSRSHQIYTPNENVVKDIPFNEANIDSRWKPNSSRFGANLAHDMCVFIFCVTVTVATLVTCFP